MLDPKQGIGKIRMGTFQESTPRELREAIDHLKASGLRGLILDLRGNPGGNFMAAVDSARLFLPDGIIVSTSGQIDEFSERYFTSELGMLAWDFPVAIVVDSRTMSSAEIFTSALVDQGRAVVVGTTTFGKGMIQSPIPLRGPESLLPGRAGALWLSTGVALRSGGIPVEGHGIVPQFVEPDCERQLPLALEKLLDLVRMDMITDPMMKE
jgi:C-terminal peptidase prc